MGNKHNFARDIAVACMVLTVMIIATYLLTKYN